MAAGAFRDPSRSRIPIEKGLSEAKEALHVFQELGMSEAKGVRAVGRGSLSTGATDAGSILAPRNIDGISVRLRIEPIVPLDR